MERSDSARSGRKRVSRRAFLGGVTAATLPLVAGCARVTENTFTATPVTIASDDAEAIGLEERARNELTRVEEGSSLGMGVTTTITSPYSAYGSPVAADGNGADPDEADRRTVSALATPRAEVLSNERNPLADLALQAHLYDPRTQPFREEAGLGEIGRVWSRNSTRLGSEQVRAMGLRTTLTSVGGFHSAPEPSLLVVHYTKVEISDDVIVLFAVQERPVETTDQPILGPEGHMSETELAAKRTATTAAFDSFRRE